MKPYILALVFLSASAAGTAAADDLKSLAKHAQSSVLLLRVLDGTGREIGTGTGFYASSDGLLVTNYHVIAPARRIEAVPAEGSPLQVRGIVAVDEANDLAVLRIETARSRPCLDARVPRDSDLQRYPELDSALDQVGVVLRIVNGYMQHWKSTDAQILRIEKGDFQRISMDLDPRCWKNFESDGTGRADPADQPDFSIIAALNISLGGYLELASDPTPGDGCLDLREIRVE